MNESAQAATWVHSIDLAQEADFELGQLHVRPARCEIESGGHSQTLQRRVMQVLVALAEARGSVISQQELITRCWRGLSVSDDAIVRCISMLRKLAADYPEPPFEIETIPGVGYRLTSSSYAKEALSATATKRRVRLPTIVAAAALVVGILIAALVWNDRRETASEAHSLRVTVQPFETLSNSDDVRTLARRIPSEVVDALGDSQIEAALGGVAGRSSKSSSLTVTGSVRDDATNRIVDVRIEDGETHGALWSAEFKRDTSRASDLPAEVAARVADMANMVAFARTAHPPLTDNSALSALLQTSAMMREVDDSIWAQLIQHAQDVVTRHPEFAFGHSLLSAAYATAAQGIDVPDRAAAMREAARREANLTLRLDPQDAGAYAVLSALETFYDWRAQEVILLRGIKFAKHPQEPLGALYQSENGLLDNVGRLREGLSYQLVAQAKDQWSPSKTSRLAFVYANLGNLPAARGLLQKAMERWPNHLGVLGYQRYVAGFYEAPTEALAMFNRLDAQGSPGNGQNAVWRTYIESKSGHSGNPVAVQKIREAADQGIIPRETEIAMLAGLGETKQAMEVANSALDHQRLEPRFFLFTPVTRDIRLDPGFVPLAARMGLIKYWRETGKLPDFCTDQARRSECTPQLRAALKA